MENIAVTPGAQKKFEARGKLRRKKGSIKKGVSVEEMSQVVKERVDDLKGDETRPESVRDFLGKRVSDGSEGDVSFTMTGKDGLDESREDERGPYKGPKGLRPEDEDYRETYDKALTELKEEYGVRPKKGKKKSVKKPGARMNLGAERGVDKKKGLLARIDAFTGRQKKVVLSRLDALGKKGISIKNALIKKASSDSEMPGSRMMALIGALPIMGGRKVNDLIGGIKQKKEKQKRMKAEAKAYQEELAKLGEKEKGDFLKTKQELKELKKRDRRASVKDMHKGEIEEKERELQEKLKAYQYASIEAFKEEFGGPQGGEINFAQLNKFLLSDERFGEEQLKLKRGLLPQSAKNFVKKHWNEFGEKHESRIKRSLILGLVPAAFVGSVAIGTGGLALGAGVGGSALAMRMGRAFIGGQVGHLTHKWSRDSRRGKAEERLKKASDVIRNDGTIDEDLLAQLRKQEKRDATAAKGFAITGALAGGGLAGAADLDTFSNVVDGDNWDFDSLKADLQSATNDLESAMGDLGDEEVTKPMPEYSKFPADENITIEEAPEAVAGGVEFTPLTPEERVIFSGKIPTGETRFLEMDAGKSLYPSLREAFGDDISEELANKMAGNFSSGEKNPLISGDLSEENVASILKNGPEEVGFKFATVEINSEGRILSVQAYDGEDTSIIELKTPDVGAPEPSGLAGQIGATTEDSQVTASRPEPAPFSSKGETAPAAGESVTSEPMAEPASAESGGIESFKLKSGDSVYKVLTDPDRGGVSGGDAGNALNNFVAKLQDQKPNLTREVILQEGFAKMQPGEGFSLVEDLSGELNLEAPGVMERLRELDSGKGIVVESGSQPVAEPAPEVGEVESGTEWREGATEVVEEDPIYTGSAGGQHMENSQFGGGPTEALERNDFIYSFNGANAAHVLSELRIDNDSVQNAILGAEEGSDPANSMTVGELMDNDFTDSRYRNAGEFWRSKNSSVETDFQFSSPAAQRFLEGLGGISYGDAKDLFAIGQYLQEQAGNHSDLNLNELRDVPVGELLQRFQTVDPDSATNFSASQGGPSTWDHLKSRAGEIHNRQVEGFNNLHERQMERAGRLADWTRGAAGSTVEGVRDAAGTVGDFLERGAEEVGGRARDAFDGDNSMEGEVGTREEIPEPLAPLSDDEGLSPTPPAEPAAERELDLSPNAVGDVESEEFERALDNGDRRSYQSTAETQPSEVAAEEVDTESVSREGEVEMPDFEDTVGGGADATWGQESTRPIQEDDIARIFE